MTPRCPVCGVSLVTDKGETRLHCAQCLALRSREAIYQLQGEFLPSVIRRDYPPMRLLQRQGRKEWHVEMLGPIRHQAFCGAIRTEPKKGRSEWRAREAAYSKLAKEPDLCVECRGAMEQKITALAATEAR